MANYLLDTNHASTLVTLSNSLRHRILDAIQQGDRFSVCVPVVCEVWQGISLLPRALANQTEWGKIRAGLGFFQLFEEDAKTAAELQVSLRKQGWQLGTIDALIAAIALRYDLILLTSDKDFSAVPNLKTDNWR
ncbi:MAG TPA: type II toxin-antitoxin system VapC family toxin [Blastocatellia bacterium]|nr:type II toxin-antitoxin system VapC family toxin [Blastocatellia bacterium]